MIIRKIFTLFFILNLFGCTLFKGESVSYNIEFPKELDQVNNLILEKKTDDARMKIDDYLNKSENIHWFGHAYFLKAFLYEIDENYPESVKHYRSAIQHSSQYDSKVEAKALYNLSFVFEKMNQRNELVITLLDLMKRREFFDILTAQVEIPARLAAAYFSQEKEKEGRIFHREASQNFSAMVRRKHFQASKDELSKSLYYLGAAVFNPNSEKYHLLINKLNLGQKYFLASAEASKSLWADRATDRLLGQYDLLWEMIRSRPINDPSLDKMAQKKQNQMAQLEMASNFYDLLHRLKVEEFPMLNVNQRSKTIMDQADQWIVKIENFALSLNLGPEMTRNQKVKNKKLSLFIEEEKKPVKVNKEISNDKGQPPPLSDDKMNVTKAKIKSDEKIKSKPKGDEDLPKKEKIPSDIGEDPNL